MSALKEALEDISRHRADELANSRRFLVMMDKQERAVAREAEAAEAAKNGGAAAAAHTAGGVLEHRGRSGSGQAVLHAPGMNKQTVASSSRGEPADHAASSHHLHRRSPSMLFPNPDGSAAESASSYFRVLSSKQIRVGQILLVRKDEEFPADLLLLSAASQDATCFVNTANLDGEAVPKVRAAPACTMHLVTPAAIDSLQGTVVVEKPSASMYRFQGRVQLDARMQSVAAAAAAAKKAGVVGGASPNSIFNDPAGINAKLSQLQTDELSTPSKPARRASGPPSPASRGSARGSRRGSGSHAAKLIDGHYHYPINDQQLLLRGSKLVNTPWVFGLVIYTGAQSKLMLNRSAPKFKFSKFEQQLNKFVVMLFLFNLVVCLALAAGFVLRPQRFSDAFSISPSSSGVGFILNFLTQYILFSFMIPMSLYVTIELVKVGQAKFMEWDTRMMYFDTEGGEGADGTPGVWKAMIVKNSSICEELGNLDYVFSDKTGKNTISRSCTHDAMHARAAAIVILILCVSVLHCLLLSRRHSDSKQNGVDRRVCGRRSIQRHKLADHSKRRCECGCSCEARGRDSCSGHEDAAPFCAIRFRRRGRRSQRRQEIALVLAAVDGGRSMHCTRALSAVADGR